MLNTLLLPLLIAAAAATPVSSVHIADTGSENPVLRTAAAIAARHIAARSQVDFAAKGDGAFNVEFGVDPTLPPEEYTIMDAPNGVRITGGQPRAVLYGLGKFLRTSGYAAQLFTPSSWRGASAPNGSFRAIYAATHFNNYYEAAPAEEVSRYLEDLALWGANAVIVHFPTWSFSGFDDPGAQRNLDQIRRLFATARATGMQTGLVQCPNQSFTSAPDSIRATPNPDPTKRRGNMGVNCCPSSPEAKAHLLDVYSQLFAEFKDIGIDYFVSWPYDEGGCGCAACAPWGAKAFPELTKSVAALGREAFPDMKTILSTWVYDTPPEGEWEGLSRLLEQDAAWLDGIMCDDHFDFPRYPLDHGAPAKLPLYNFPEISMWGRGPWGAYGANPLPARYEALWRQASAKLAGGMPYSEGIYEDMNKVLCFQFYWNRGASAQNILCEYVAFEFSPDAVVPVLDAIRLLESAWLERSAESQEAFALLSQVDASLPPWARQGWRWRLLYLRGLIDSELLRTGGHFEGGVLRDAVQELTAIYHAENAHPNVKPRAVP
ncbi:MAG: hypothetical protein HYV27_02345 [Candidatus Hydrogenedentes bacterium]|nr:hypothetical protein [Candidatus Hydrogenedentota bacterium]